MKLNIRVVHLKRKYLSFFAIAAIMFSVSVEGFASEPVCIYPPTAVITKDLSGTSFKDGITITFSGTSSTSGDCNPMSSYTWFVDGVVVTPTPGSSYTRSFELPVGTYQKTYAVKLQVTNSSSQSDDVTMNITVNKAKRIYFVKDHLGSVRTTVDEEGTAIGYDDYYPFGLAMEGRTNNTSNPTDNYKFTGHERDTEGSITLDYMGARNYDPIIGRFLQIDPLADQFPGWSPYNYTMNNPVNLVDPTGMAAECSEETDEAQAECEAEAENDAWLAQVEAERAADDAMFDSDFSSGGGYGSDASGQEIQNNTPQSQTESEESQQILTDPDPPSIVYNNRELNPNGMVLRNPTLIVEILALYSGLVEKIGNENFQFVITGGDRYVGATEISGEEYKRAYSSTDHKEINSLAPAHIRDDAVDIRIKYNDGTLIPIEIVRSVILNNKTRLILDENALPEKYSDRHYHFQLPIGWKNK